MSRVHNDFIESRHLEEVECEGPLSGASRRTLSQDDGSGAETSVLRLPAGWAADLSGLTGSIELLLLSGELKTAAGVVPGEGWLRAPVAAALGRVQASSEVEMLFMPDPSATSEGQVQIIDVRAVPWLAGVRGGPGGIAVKTLSDGPVVSLIIANVPRYGSGAEFHECPEELFVIAGDVRGTHGTMTAGSYFWRPEYITHGPYWSESGLLTFVRGHGDIYAHWIEDPESTVEDNMAYVAALARRRRTKEAMP